MLSIAAKGVSARNERRQRSGRLDKAAFDIGVDGLKSRKLFEPGLGADHPTAPTSPSTKPS